MRGYPNDYNAYNDYNDYNDHKDHMEHEKHSPAYKYALQCDMDDAYMRRLYPRVCSTIRRYAEEECIRRENLGQLSDQQEPSPQVLSEMVDVIYRKCKPHMLGDDFPRQPYYYDRDNIFRDLISVILIGELFRRRRLRRRRFFFGY
jgi:hypothetical protein